MKKRFAVIIMFYVLIVLFSLSSYAGIEPCFSVCNEKCLAPCYYNCTGSADSTGCREKCDVSCNLNCGLDCSTGADDGFFHTIIGRAVDDNSPTDPTCFRVCHKYCVMPDCANRCEGKTDGHENALCMMDCYDGCTTDCNYQCNVSAMNHEDNLEWTFEFWAMMGFFVAVGLAASGWFLTKRHRKETLKLLNQIEAVYHSYSKHRETCVIELDKMKAKIKNEYAQNKIEENNFDYLIDIIDKHINKIHRHESAKLLENIELVYRKNSRHRNACIIELNKLKQRLDEEFAQDRIVESNYEYMLQKINDYMHNLTKHAGLIKTTANAKRSVKKSKTKKK